MLDFFTEYSKYVLISTIASPILFLIANQLWLHGKVKQVSTGWRKKEREKTKHWSQQEFIPVDKTVKKHTKQQLQSGGVLLFAVILNIILQPAVIILTLGLAPFTLWLVTFLLLSFRVHARSKLLLHEGLHMKGVIHHHRFLKRIDADAKISPYIPSPYAFLYHYIRLEKIPEQLNDIIRSDKDSKVAREESEIISEEEHWLTEELILLFSGRVKYYNLELASDRREAMNRMLRHARNPELSTTIRKQAMALANELQSRAEAETIEEAKELDALLDIETVERFYV